MKFYGNAIVWDKENDMALCRFDESGEFVTDDPRTIKILTELGYRNDVIDEVEADEMEAEEVDGVETDVLDVCDIPLYDDETKKSITERLQAWEVEHDPTDRKQVLYDLMVDNWRG